MKTKVLVLAGPTAVGKTEIAVGLAQIMGADIISADSRQVYKYLDIGTAKPTPGERKRVPHHLIDFLDPKERYSAAAFAHDARTVMARLESAGRPFLVVGGTGLYIKALTEGLSPIPEVADDISQRLAQEARESGLERLYSRLCQVDPKTAARLSPRDRCRILRALEVYEATGRPISQWQQEPRMADGRAYEIVVLNRARNDLYHRIEKRVEAMMAAGFLDEVRMLKKRGYGPDLEHIRAVGYREILSHLRGDIDLSSAVALIKQNTRRFAKRQLTWFRNTARARWLEMASSPQAKEEIISHLLKIMGIK